MFPNTPAGSLPNASVVPRRAAEMTSTNDLSALGDYDQLVVHDGENGVVAMKDPGVAFVDTLNARFAETGLAITASDVGGKLRLVLNDPSFTKSLTALGYGRYLLGLPHFAAPSAGGSYDTDADHVRVAGQEYSLADALTALPPAPSLPLAVVRVDATGATYELVDVGGRNIPSAPASVTGMSNPLGGGPLFDPASPLSDYGFVDGDVLTIAYTDFVIGQGIAVTQTLADLLAAIQAQTNVAGTVGTANGKITFERATDLILDGAALGKLGLVPGVYQQTDQVNALACTDNLFHVPTAQVLQGLLEDLRSRISLLEVYVQSHP